MAGYTDQLTSACAVTTKTQYVNTRIFPFPVSSIRIFRIFYFCFLWQTSVTQSEYGPTRFIYQNDANDVTSPMSLSKVGKAKTSFYKLRVIL